MEDIQIAIEGELRKCTVDELRTVGTGINIQGDAIGNDKTKAQVMREIAAVLDGLDDDEQKKAMMMRMLPHAPAQTSTAMMGILSGNTAQKVDPTQNKQVDDTLKLLQSLGLDTTASSRFRRECKINGTIDEKSADSLNYIGLCSEVADAKKKGYKEAEIAMAVRKSVATRSVVRKYLDAKSDLTLTEMLAFVRTALHEKSASQLHQDLTDAVQEENEDAQTFVNRVMLMREEILKASLAESAVRFDPQSVRDLYLQAIRTGLKDNVVKAQIEPLVRRGATTMDTELLLELDHIASEESVRQAKLVKEKEKADVCINEAHIMKGNDPDADFCVRKSNPILEVVDVVKELKDEVKCLRMEVNDLREKGASANKKPKYGCEYCIKNNRGSFCRHCFSCGAGDHKRDKCPRTNTGANDGANTNNNNLNQM